MMGWAARTAAVVGAVVGGIAAADGMWGAAALAWGAAWLAMRQIQPSEAQQARERVAQHRKDRWL